MASGFITQAAADTTNHQWTFVVSEAVRQNLPPRAVSDNRLTVVDLYPRQLASSRVARRALTGLERDFRPDVVFTVFGPPYWSPHSKHVCGFAGGWAVLDAGAAWRTVPLTRRPAVYAGNLYRLSKLSRSWFYWMETATATCALARKLRISVDRTYVIPNCPHPVFLESTPQPAATSRVGSSASVSAFPILCLSAYYDHKNLELVPEVAADLVSLGFSCFVFWLSLPQEGAGWRRIAESANKLGVSDKVVNLGPQRIQDCPDLYGRAAAVFLPTLLEVFSATYVESIVMRKPLVTTDIAPAREVCGQAALFFAPFDHRAAAGHLARLMSDAAFYGERVEACEAAAPSIVTPEEKFRMTLDMLEKVALGGV